MHHSHIFGMLLFSGLFLPATALDSSPADRVNYRKIRVSRKGAFVMIPVKKPDIPSYHPEMAAMCCM